MKNSTILTLFLISITTAFYEFAFAQGVYIGADGSGSPSASAILDLDVSDLDEKKGLLIPRMTEGERDEITSPATSLLIYQTNGDKGYYYYDGSSWETFGDDGGGGSGTGWTLSGNTVTGGGDAYFGTVNNKPINLKINNQPSGILDKDGNVVIGYQSNNDNNSANVGLGKGVTIYGNNHDNHVAIGNSVQIQAGNNTKSAVAIGNGANVTGGSNHSYSIAVGNAAQVQAANGIAFGRNANVNQQYGMAIGDAAQAQGSSGIAIGQSAYTNKTGTVTLGKSAQTQGNYAISIGESSYTNNTNGIAIGKSAQAQGSNTIVLGYNIYNGNSNTAAIGNSSITSVKLSGASSNSYALVVGTSSSNGNGAYLTKGGVWTNASDINLKEDITAVDANEVLAKVASMEINKWKYIGTDEYHIGPMAQDFHAAFQLGIDTNRISTIDPAGIALVSIKALNEKVEKQEAVIANITRLNATLMARLEALEEQRK